MVNLDFSGHQPKESVKAAVEKYLSSVSLRVASSDFTRPWGGFFVLDESQAEAFMKLYFPHLKADDLRIGGKLSPKILMVAPDQRLSWQYHHRRAEIWRLVGGVAGVVTSQTDVPGDVHAFTLGEIIQLKQGERHRLVGLSGGWGMIAEIWQHTDPKNPSDESDIVRVQDDFGR